MSSTTVTRGNSHETFYIQPSLTPVGVSANTTAIQTFSLPGLTTTDLVEVIELFVALAFFPSFPLTKLKIVPIASPNLYKSSTIPPPIDEA